MNQLNLNEAHEHRGYELQGLTPLVITCILGKCKIHDWYSLRLVRQSDYSQIDFRQGTTMVA